MCVYTFNYCQDDSGSKYEGLLRYSNRSVSYYMHVHNWNTPELNVGADSGKLSNFAFPSQRPCTVCTAHTCLILLSPYRILNPDAVSSVTSFEAQLLLGTGLINMDAHLFLEVGHGHASPVQKMFNKLHFVTFIYVPRDQEDIDRC